jgi:hypothetical protein
MSTLRTTNLQHASAASPAIVLASSGSATAQLSSINDGPLSGMRNRIINGDMRIDQRNAGASVTPTDPSYTLDRWKFRVSQTSKLTVQQNAGSITPPAGFSNYLGVTSSSAYSVNSTDYFVLLQDIEGYNFSDFNFGTANAKTLTVSFWVRSSLTGTFNVSVRNSAFDRSYPATYTISAANTWEQKIITIAGDTSGTWVSGSNGIGLSVIFNLGCGSTFNGTSGSWQSANYTSVSGATSVVGTNGATFYITGVQLEPGSVATPFERRSYGQELMLCQRYCYVTPAYIQSAIGALNSATSALISFPLPVPMRAAPTVTASTTVTLDDYYSATVTGSLAGSATSPHGVRINVSGLASQTLPRPMQLAPGNAAIFTASAEL